MKSFLLTILACLAFDAAAQNVQNIRIGDAQFFLAYTNASADGYLREYCLRNETTNNWTKLFAVRHFKKVESPKKYIGQMAQDYRKKFPQMSFASGGDDKKNLWLIDYVVYDKKEPKLIEWDVFRAQTNAAGGILVYQYAERMTYKNSMAELDVKGLRKRMMPVMATNQFVFH
jgi:hypothetical protein